MDAVAPSWYPDPQRDGQLRWWDGTRWTEFVQPARAAGKPVLGQEVTGGIGPVTFYAPGEEITHAYPPLTDPRYAGIELAERLLAQARASAHGGDVRVSGEQQAEVEAVYQLRKRGGLLGALSIVGEQLLVHETPRPVRTTPTPDQHGVVAYGTSSLATWSPTGPAPAAGSGIVTPRPPADSPWGEPDARPKAVDVASTAIRGAVVALGVWGLISSLGGLLLFTLVAVVLAVVLPPDDGGSSLVVWSFPLIGAVCAILVARELIGVLRSRR